MIVPLQASAIVRKEEAKAAELQRREGLNEERSALHSTIESEFVEEMALGKRGGAVTEVHAKKLKGFVEEVTTADGPGIIAHGRAWELLEKHANVSNVTLNCCHVPRQAASLLRLQSLTNLTCLTLKRCAIENIAQLLPLQFLTTLSKLNLPDNPIQTSPLLRPFLVWKMPNIGVVDGVKFSAQEIKQSSAIFDPYSRQISDFYRHVGLLFCEHFCLALTLRAEIVLVLHPSSTFCYLLFFGKNSAPRSPMSREFHIARVIFTISSEPNRLQIQNTPRIGRNLQLLRRQACRLRYRSCPRRPCSVGAVVRIASPCVYGSQAALVFDTRIAALQKMWRDLPMECVKARGGTGSSNCFVFFNDLSLCRMASLTPML